MPWLVSAFTYRPSTTLIFCLIDSSGSRVLESFISAPLPSALQWFSLTPQPRKTTPKRLGKSAEDGSARAFTDSSQGNAMAQPVPRSTARREKARERKEGISVILILLAEIGLDQLGRGRLFRGDGLSGGVGHPAVEELRAENNRVHQGAELVAVRDQACLHLVHKGFIRQLQRAVQRISHQLAGQVAGEIVLAV